jgi:hypothetical protein
VPTMLNVLLPMLIGNEFIDRVADKIAVGIPEDRCCGTIREDDAAVAVNK